MASSTKELMDLFHDLRTAAAKQSDFESVGVYDSCENMVNNLMHGRAFADIYPLLRKIFLENSESNYTSPQEKEHYITAIMWMDMFAEDKGLTKP